MSRGLGQLQRAIVGCVGEAAEPATVESMRWAVYERMKKPPIAINGDLPSEWNTSFGRAINNLASESRSLLVIEKRHMASLEECIVHYPGKTLQAPVRRLRQELLPALYEWTQEKYGASPHYSAADNEEYFLKRVSADRVNLLRREWVRLESLMRPSFTSLGPDDLFLLFAKGRSLFQGIDVTSRCSFAEMVQRCCRSDILPEPVANQLRAFSGRFLSATAAGR